MISTVTVRMWNVVSNGFIFQCQFPQLLTCHTFSGWVKIFFTPQMFFFSNPNKKICQEIELEGVEVRLERGKSGNPSFLIRSCWKTHGENPMTKGSASQVLTRRPPGRISNGSSRY